MTKAHKEEKPEEAPEPPEPVAVEGFAVYDKSARSIGHLFLDGDVEDAEQGARVQFARLHEHSGDAVNDLRLVSLKEIANTEEFSKNPEDFEAKDEEADG